MKRLEIFFAAKLILLYCSAFVFGIGIASVALGNWEYSLYCLGAFGFSFIGFLLVRMIERNEEDAE